MANVFAIEFLIFENPHDVFPFGTKGEVERKEVRGETLFGKYFSRNTLNH